MSEQVRSEKEKQKDWQEISLFFMAYQKLFGEIPSTPKASEEVVEEKREEIKP